MASFNTITGTILILEIATLVLMLSCCRPCYADDINGDRGSSCGVPAAPDATWTANLNSLSSSLAANVIPNNGYYKTEVGRNPNKVYGLIQCRGDVPPAQCDKCTRESFRLASENCNGDRSVTIWQKWCHMRYSNTSFFGDWERGSLLMSNETSLDDPNVVAKGMSMMAGLVEAAPNEKLLFAKSEVDVGNGGNRYGMAQCTRDLRKKDCGDCLDFLLKNVGGPNGNKREWEIYSDGCSLWYDDSRFYFNYTAPSPANGADRAWAGRFWIGLTILMSEWHAFDLFITF